MIQFVMDENFLRAELELDENVTFLYHFKGENAYRQIEIYPDRTVKLTAENPVSGDSYLCDQNLSEMDIDPSYFIYREEFDRIWNLD